VALWLIEGLLRFFDRGLVIKSVSELVPIRGVKRMKISKRTKSKENTSLKNFSEENHATKHTRYINRHICRF
jgi:hypothetical protein